MNLGTSTRKKKAYQIVVSLHGGAVAATVATLVSLAGGNTTTPWFLHTIAALLFLTAAVVVYMTAMPYSKSRTMTFSTAGEAGADRLLKVSTKDNGVTILSYTVDGKVVYEGPEDECPQEIIIEVAEYRRACIASMVGEFNKCEHDA